VIRVLVVEDSPTARKLLVSLLSADPEITIVGEATDGAEGVAMCKQLKPDIVTMDIQMPTLDGIEATRRIMIDMPTPIVLVSTLDPGEVRRTMQAFRAGALAVHSKPTGPGTPKFERDARALVATVKAMAQVRLVRRWPAVPPYAGQGSPPPAQPRPAQPAMRPGQRASVIGIVASTGGPNAVRTVLEGLPAAFVTPVLIVQHIAPGFAEGFAEWLRDTSKRDVRIAQHGAQLEDGVVHVAGDDRHLEVSSNRIVVSDAAPLDGFRPSGSKLLWSLALSYGARAVGVILTGMGNDGVAGLRAVREAGGACYAQDEASSDVFGMPGAAVAAGVVTETTPLAEIADRLAIHGA
jgi:two-component system, chemotaxis family, protein-glutamate methylesterase/glutaminase